MVSLAQDGKPADGAAPTPPAAASAGTAAAEPELPWVKEFPFDDADEKMMALGKLKYNTTCSVCHGLPATARAWLPAGCELAQGYWVTPTSLHEPRIQEQAVGKISYHHHSWSWQDGWIRQCAERQRNAGLSCSMFAPCSSVDNAPEESSSSCTERKVDRNPKVSCVGFQHVQFGRVGPVYRERC